MSSIEINDDLDKVLHLSIKLVVLQNLVDCYERENTSDNPQEVCNFRSCCILDELKAILDRLQPYIIWLASVDEGTIKCKDAHKDSVAYMALSFTKIYDFVLEESNKKEARLKLIELEQSMFSRDES